MGKKRKKKKSLGNKIISVVKKASEAKTKALAAIEKGQAKVRSFSEETGIGQVTASDLLGLGETGDVFGLDDYRKKRKKK